MNFKKIMVLTLIAIMVFLAACGGAGTTESTAAKTNEAAANSGSAGAGTAADVPKDTLVVAIWDTNQEPGLTKIINDFTAATGIKAEIQVTPWNQYWTMLEAGATGGTLPDVFWMNSNEISRYSEYNMLLDLTDKIAASDKVDLTKFPKEIVEIYKWQGKKQYAVPKDIDTVALWYNKKMFDEAGLSYPDQSWTWDTFKDACKKLTKKDGSQYGYALTPSNTQDGWYNLVYDMGGTIITDDKKTSGFAHPGTIKAIEYAYSLLKDGLTPSYETLVENLPNALFEAGKIAMTTQGSWMLPELCNNDYVKANCDIAVLPKDAITGKRVSIYNGLGWAAAANTDKPDQAWKLIEYFGSEEAQKKQADLGIVISAYEGSVTNWTKAYPDFNIQAYLDMMKDVVIRPNSKSTVTWENMSIEKLVDVWKGAKSASDVCSDIAKEMNKLLSEE